MRDQRRIARLPREHAAFDEVFVRIVSTVDDNGHVPQAKERLGQQLRVATCAGDPHAALREGEGLVVTASQAAKLVGDIQRTAARHVFLLRIRMRECLQHHPMPELEDESIRTIG